MPIRIFLALALWSVCLQYTSAQSTQDTSQYLVQTTDGNEYLGRIVDQDGDILRLLTDNLGEINIRKQDIKSLTRVSHQQIVGGEYYFENPQATRYFWAPNGYGLRAGEGYYQNVWVMFNQVAYGVTDYFSIGAGMVPLFFFAGASTPVWVTPKFSIPVAKDKFNLGAGVLAGSIIGEDVGIFGIAYGVATVGNRDKNASFGLGYGFAEGEWTRTPVISISGMLRTGQRGYLLSENYFVSADGESVIMLSLGGRRIIKRTGIDFGLWFPISSETFVAFPWLGVSFPIGGNR